MSADYNNKSMKFRRKTSCEDRKERGSQLVSARELDVWLTQDKARELCHGFVQWIYRMMRHDIALTGHERQQILHAIEEIDRYEHIRAVCHTCESGYDTYGYGTNPGMGTSYQSECKTLLLRWALLGIDTRREMSALEGQNIRHAYVFIRRECWGRTDDNYMCRTCAGK